MSPGKKIWRRIERALLGVLMVAVARVVERRLLRAVRAR